MRLVHGARSSCELDWRLPLSGRPAPLVILGVVSGTGHYFELSPLLLAHDLLLLARTLIFQVCGMIDKRPGADFIFLFSLRGAILMVALDALFPGRGVVQV